MAKKKTTPNDTSTAPSAPVRRRAPVRKKADAAPPIDLASVAGTEPRGNGKTQPSHDEIAEAAYFRHLRRGGGGHGDDFEDWIEAERELRRRRES